MLSYAHPYEKLVSSRDRKRPPGEKAVGSYKVVGAVSDCMPCRHLLAQGTQVKCFLSG